jgi:hypothetical protein
MSATWVHLDVVDLAGRLAVLEVKVRRDFVECWLGHRCLAMVDRGTLTEWVLERRDEVTSGELVLLHSPLGPVIEAPGALAPSPLTPTTFLDLRSAVT